MTVHLKFQVIQVQPHNLYHYQQRPVPLPTSCVWWVGRDEI